MKKLLILTLVLGLTSAAFADLDGWSLQISYDGGATYVEPVDSEVVLYPSDYLWIGIHNAVEGSAQDIRQSTKLLAMYETDKGEWTGNYVQYKPPLVPDAPENVYYGLYYGIDVWLVDLSDGNPAHFNGAGVLDAKEFHCLGVGDVEIILLESDATTIADSFIIHQIPEPATIALLGLGGLLLRRRK